MIIMFRRCVRTVSGRSPSLAFFLLLRRRLMSAIGFLFRPRWNLRLRGTIARRGGGRQHGAANRVPRPRPATATEARTRSSRRDETGTGRLDVLAPPARVQELHQLIRLEVQQLRELHAPVRELAEALPLGLHLGRHRLDKILVVGLQKHSVIPGPVVRLDHMLDWVLVLNPLAPAQPSG